MPEFSFVEGDQPRRRPDDGETFEERRTDIVDGKGRSISFSIRRILNRCEPYAAMHLRWVYVMGDGEIIREYDSNAHETNDEAEAWVDKKIRDCIARYQRQRGGAAVSRVTRTRRAAKRSSGWRFVLLVACIVLASPFVAALWLSLTIRR